MLDTQIAFKIISNMLKQANFFYSQPSTPPKNTSAEFYLSTAFGLRFKISSAAHARSSTFYVYLITKIKNRLELLYIRSARRVGLPDVWLMAVY